MDKVMAFLSAEMHTLTEAIVLLLEAVCVLSVLLYPNETRLSMAKDVGGLVAMVMGIVGGVHGWKAVTKIGASPKDDPC